MSDLGKCSVPMWMGGLPCGTCGQPAYGLRPPSATWWNAYAGEEMRIDGKYNGFVPGLACPGHGGPKLKDVAHRADPCIYCETPHDDVPIGPCKGKRLRELPRSSICANELQDAINLIGQYCAEQMPLGWQLTIIADSEEVTCELTDPAGEEINDWEGDEHNPVIDACTYARKRKTVVRQTLPINGRR